MDYTLSEVHNKIKEFADKLGSDYFQLPEILNRFQSETLEFVGEKLRVLEKTQEVVEDIRPLVVPGNLAVIKDPNDATRYIAAIPTNYLQILSVKITYADGMVARSADIQTHSEKEMNLYNPNRRPAKMYPVITQEDSMFHVDAGGEAPYEFKMMYCKKPTFATSGQPDTRIVNLPDTSIENILLATVTGLFGRTADQRAQISDQFDKTFRKVYV